MVRLAADTVEAGRIVDDGSAAVVDGKLTVVPELIMTDPAVIELGVELTDADTLLEGGETVTVTDGACVTIIVLTSIVLTTIVSTSSVLVAGELFEAAVNTSLPDDVLAVVEALTLDCG